MSSTTPASQGGGRTCLDVPAECAVIRHARETGSWPLPPSLNTTVTIEERPPLPDSISASSLLSPSSQLACRWTRLLIQHPTSQRAVNEAFNCIVQATAAPVDLNDGIGMQWRQSVERVRARMADPDWPSHHDGQLADLPARMDASLRSMKHALDDIGWDRVGLSYNGGKDCTVLVHLLMTLCPTKALPAIFIVPDKEFPSVLAYARSVAHECGLELIESRESMKPGLITFLDRYPQLKAILVGTRRTDPFAANLAPLQRTDPDWPSFMRINPLLDWTYEHIWMYLLSFGVPYCPLYDMGYTSLGALDDTIPNPYLRQPLQPSGYDPAYTLLDWDGSRERASRCVTGSHGSRSTTP